MRGWASTNWDDRRARFSRRVPPLVRFARPTFEQFDKLPEGFLRLSELLEDEALAPDENLVREARREISNDRAVSGLAKLRLNRGFSQIELAKLIGSSQPRLSMWEQGNSQPNLTNLERLQKALDVSYDDLLKAFLNE